MQEKNIAVSIVLSIVTFGIYYLVWIFGIMKKIKLLASEEPKCGGEIALFIFIPFYALFWMYSRSKKLAAAGTACGVPMEDKSLINLLLAIFGFGFVSVALMQVDLNKAAVAFRAAA
jgi:prepilin signal peptidase PulO-like enzyme (type II secretory pathway)